MIQPLSVIQAMPICLLSTLFLCSNATALELSAVIADHMVIKRETEAPLWGWGSPGEEVKAVASWGETASATADADGKWMLKIKTPEADGTPQTITFRGASSSITVENVLVGDVWHASGQSNMQMTVDKCQDYEKEELGFQAVRRMRVLHNASKEPLQQFAEVLPWMPITRESADTSSATAYFFARTVFKETGIPQGIIETPWNGKPLEPFYAASELKKFFPEEYKAMRQHPKFSDPSPGKLERKIPGSNELMANENHFGWVFNGKVAPIIPFAITGTIWYQGESNGGNKLLYEHKLRALATTWRAAWGQGDFPFYFVQLNSNKPTDGTPADGGGFAGINEGMRRAFVSGETPNLGMAVIWDTGNPNNYTPKPGTREGGIMLHCPNKQDVGKRLAQWALRDIHGQNRVVSGPIYRSHQVKGNQIILSFDHVGSGLIAAEKKGLNPPTPTPGKLLHNFAIAGEDRKFVWAEARIDGKTVVVSSPDVPEPKAVRFCFNSAPFRYFNFYNQEGLPASPFITDDWYQ